MKPVRAVAAVPTPEHQCSEFSASCPCLYLVPASQEQRRCDGRRSLCRMFTLLGPQAHTLVAEWGSEELMQLPEYGHMVLAFNGTPIIAVKTSGLGPHVPGWTFVVDETQASDFWRKAALKGALPMGADVWERVRVLNGVPRVGVELTEDANPMEAGLYSAVSLAKGCYIGQETLAKVHNNNGAACLVKHPCSG